MATIQTTPEQGLIDRRRAIAMALQQASMQPLQSPQVRGARVSPLEGVNKIVQSLMASRQNAQLDQEQTALTGQQDAAQAQRMKALVAALAAQGTDPAKAQTIAESLTAGDPGANIGLQSILPQAPPADFTLSPGQERFSGANGGQVAAVPVTPPTPAAPAPFTLSPGQQRFDPSGQPVASVPPLETVPKEAIWEPDKVMVDGVGTAVLRNNKGDYLDANTKKPVTGRITPYIAPPTPRQKGEITPNAEAGLITNLNKQWETASKDVQSLYRANTIMSTGMDAARRGDMNAGSQAVLVTFQKFLDPTSVVRESEYARSGSGQSMANQVRGWVDKLEQGGAGMTLPELEKFAKAAQDIANNLNKEGASLLSAERNRIKSIADRYDIPIETVIPKYQYQTPGGTAQPQSTAPAGGGLPTVGGTFNGGTVKSVTRVPD